MSNLPVIKLENFEGPFDLLVELARQRKMDLSDVSLRTITDDFLQFLNENSLPAELKGDFLVTAATLLLLKVRQILPSLTPEEEEEVSQLTDGLRIYQLYREQAEKIRSTWGERPLLPVGFWKEGTAQFENGGSWPDITTVELMNHLRMVIDNLPKPVHKRAHLTVFGRSLQDCISLFTSRMKKVKAVIFQDETGGYSRQDTAISFLAVLELAKRKHIQLDQARPFDKITLRQSQ